MRRERARGDARGGERETRARTRVGMIFVRARAGRRRADNVRVGVRARIDADGA
jgi:hypothetical protein